MLISQVAKQMFEIETPGQKFNDQPHTVKRTWLEIAQASITHKLVTEKDGQLDFKGV